MADPSTSKPSSNIPVITPHYPPPDDGGNSHLTKKPSCLSSKLSIKPLRRVSFSETDKCFEYSPPHKSGMSRCYHRSSASSIKNSHCGCRIRGCGCIRYLSCSSPSSRCCICCLWTCIILLCLFFILAVAFALFLIYFQPRLPIFRIESLEFSTFNITTAASSQQKSLISTDIELSIVASNVNEKIDFSYSSLMVYVSSGNVTLGDGEVPGFFQLATAYSGNSNLTMPTKTVLNIRAGVSQSAVDIAEGERLRENLLESSDDDKTKMMTNLDVILSGTIKFNFRSSSSGSSVSSSSAGNEIAESEALATSNFPVSVLCKNIDMSRVAAGDKPHCKVELFTFQLYYLYASACIAMEKSSHIWVCKRSLVKCADALPPIGKTEGIPNI